MIYNNRKQSTSAKAAQLFVLALTTLLVACGAEDKFETRFNVSTNVTGEGSVDISSQLVEPNDTLSIALTPSEGYEIESVQGCNGSLVNNTYTTGAINASCKVEVSFWKQRIAVNAAAGEGGEISPASQLIGPGEAAVFTVTPSPGYQVTSVSGCEGALDGSVYTTATIDSACEVTASFESITFDIPVTVTAGGTVDKMQATAKYGEPLTFTFSPDSGFLLEYVRGCEGTLEGNVFTIAQVTSQCAIESAFIEASKAITAIEVSVVDTQLVDTQPFSLKAVATYLDNSTQDISNEVQWTSSNSTIVAVDTMGVATPELSGAVEIAAETSNGKIGKLDVDIARGLRIYGDVAGEAFVARKADGTTVAWGNTDEGGDIAAVNAQLVDVDNVYHNRYSFAALKRDRSVVTWGHADRGGNSSAVADELTNVAAIFNTRYAYAALTATGSVITWGEADDGGDSSAVASDLTSVTAISGTEKAFAALKNDGTVVVWGDNDEGGDASAVSAQLVNVLSISANTEAFAALTTNGTVITWGEAEKGGDSASVRAELINVSSVVANQEAFAALKTDGSVVSWGDSGFIDGYAAVKAQLTDVVKVYANEKAFVAVKADGSAVSWGNPDDGGNSSAVTAQLTNITKVVNTSKAFAALKNDGTVVTWGGADEGGDSSGVTDQLTNVATIVGNDEAFAVIKADGTVVTWGADGGNSSAVSAQLTDVVSIAANKGAFAAITASGVVTWGDADNGGDSASVSFQRTLNISQQS